MATWFNERTLSGSVIYSVAQKTPDGSSEGPIMNVGSNPINVHKGHVIVDLSDITHTEALRLYRAGGYLSRYTMVEDIDPTDIYIDKRDDVTIALGRNGTLNYVDSPPEGLQWLTEHKGMLFGSVGNTLYWSSPGDANSWDHALSFVIVDRYITGLASCPNGLIIFMKNRLKLLTGDNSTNFSLRTLSNEKGTLDSYSIQEVNYGAVFFSEDGLCYTDGSRVQELSYDILGPQRFDVIDSTATNRSYYALLKDFTILRYDFGQEPVFSVLSASGVAGLGIVNGKIAHSDNDILYDTLGENYRIMKYRSGEVTEGIPTMIKEWDRVRLSGSFVGIFIIYLDGIEVINENIQIGTRDLVNLQIPKRNNKGKAISFELEGIGLVTSIEYSLTARRTTK